MAYDDNLQESISDAIDVLGIELRTLLGDNHSIVEESLVEFTGHLEILTERVNFLTRTQEEQAKVLKKQKNIRMINVITFVGNVIVLFLIGGIYLLN